MLADKARKVHFKDSVTICQSFNKYLLSTNYVPETMLNSRPTRVIKTKSSQRLQSQRLCRQSSTEKLQFRGIPVRVGSSVLWEHREMTPNSRWEVQEQYLS